MRRTAATAAVAALAAFVAGCAATTGGTATPAPTLGHAPSLVSGSDLAGLLVNVRDANTIMGTTGLSVVSRSTKMYIDKIVDSDCLGASYNAERGTYQDSGWTDLQRQNIREDADSWDHIVLQAVVLFPDGERAHDFYADQVESWPKCNNHSISDRDVARPGDEPETYWTLTTAEEHNGILSMRKIQEGGQGWSCQRGLAARNNVVVDVSTCADDISDQAIRVVQKIVEKIDDQE